MFSQDALDALSQIEGISVFTGDNKDGTWKQMSSPCECGQCELCEMQLLLLLVKKIKEGGSMSDYEVVEEDLSCGPQCSQTEEEESE